MEGLKFNKISLDIRRFSVLSSAITIQILLVDSIEMELMSKAAGAWFLPFALFEGKQAEPKR